MNNVDLLPIIFYRRIRKTLGLSLLDAHSTHYMPNMLHTHSTYCTYYMLNMASTHILGIILTFWGLYSHSGDFLLTFWGLSTHILGKSTHILGKPTEGKMDSYILIEYIIE